MKQGQEALEEGSDGTEVDEVSGHGLILAID